MTVTDDGVGGAHLAKGHGLAGLADRLHAAGGELWSPARTAATTIRSGAAVPLTMRVEAGHRR